MDTTLATSRIILSSRLIWCPRRARRCLLRFCLFHALLLADNNPCRRRRTDSVAGYKKQPTAVRRDPYPEEGIGAIGAHVLVIGCRHQSKKFDDLRRGQ